MIIGTVVYLSPKQMRGETAASLRHLRLRCRLHAPQLRRDDRGHPVRVARLSSDGSRLPPKVEEILHHAWKRIAMSVSVRRAISGSRSSSRRGQRHRRRRTRFRGIPFIDLATVHTALGDHDAALDALERGREERNGLMWARIYMHDFTPSGPHPQSLARRLGRTAPWLPES